MLLRDVAEPNRFVSTGARESSDAIERWKERDVWQGALGRFSALFDSFEIATMELVAARDADDVRPFGEPGRAPGSG